MKFVPLIITTCLILIPSTAPAPIYGSYPGLDELIKGAEFIVVADIVKGPPMEGIDIGGGVVFEIYIQKVLKGNAKEGKATAYLRDLEYAYEPSEFASLTYGIEGARSLLFLDKPGTHTHINDKPPRADFEDENCEGDAVRIGDSGLPPTMYFRSCYFKWQDRSRSSRRAAESRCRRASKVCECCGGNDQKPSRSKYSDAEVHSDDLGR